MLLLITILSLIVALGYIIYSTEKEKEENAKSRVLDIWIKTIHEQRYFAQNADTNVRKLFPALQHLSPQELRDTDEWKLYYATEAIQYNEALLEVHEFKDVKGFINALQKKTVNID
jgi:hypothetical protein